MHDALPKWLRSLGAGWRLAGEVEFPILQEKAPKREVVFPVLRVIGVEIMLVGGS